MRWCATALLVLLAACFTPTTSFVCSSADQCQAGGEAGNCEVNGYCSYPDATCDSGNRYGRTAGGGLSGICVGDEDQVLPDARPGEGGAADAADRPDAQVITGCTSHEACAPLSDACGTGSCNFGTGVCEKIKTNEGGTCAAAVCGGFDGCSGFDSTCDNSGSQSRSCTPYVCSSGACVPGGAYTDTQSCGRNTDGVDCGGVSCGDYGGCSYGTECANSGQRCRTCAPQVCSGGNCVSGGGSSDCTGGGCDRDTFGQACCVAPNDCCGIPSGGVCEGGNCACT